MLAKSTQRAVKGSQDLVARYGGEEFVVVLPSTDIDGATAIALSIQQELRRCKIIHEDSQVSEFVAISIGINCQIPTLDADFKNAIAQADAALYIAKQQGRDRYCIIH